MVEKFNENSKLHLFSKEINYTIDLWGCYNCISHHQTKGYPQLRRNGKRIYMSRYIYELYYGLIPEGMLVRHTCDNPQCINPHHLISGTHKDNARDMLERDRGRCGERSKNSKLTKTQVIQILKSENTSANVLAEKYLVSASTIRAIRNGKSWRWLKKQVEKNLNKSYQKIRKPEFPFQFHFSR